VLDFYCPAAHLAVEVDGYVHGTGDIPERDKRRDVWLNAQGVTVLRVAASDIMAHPHEEADMIWRTAMAIMSSSAKRQTGPA
jgi:very-short-patch-repair endonuclease